MATPPQLISEQEVSLSLALPDSVNRTESGSTPRKDQIYEPRTVKQSLNTVHLKEKLAAGIASLYDSVDSATQLQSPIYNNTLKVKHPTKTVQLFSAAPDSITFLDETASSLPTYTEIMDLARSDSEPSDAMDFDEKEVHVHDIRTEWVGTSQFFIEENIELQKSGTFASLTEYHKSIHHDLSRYPYDPYSYLEYARLVNKLGFTDIGAAVAHRAIVLIEGFLSRKSELHLHVQNALITRLHPHSYGTHSTSILEDEAQNLHLQAYQQLLNGLLGCASFWDGLMIAKNALNKWPRDPELLETRQWLKEGFEDRHIGLKEFGAKKQNLIVLARMGKIYQKSYPWIPADLLKRRPALISEINKKFGAGNCEVRPATFASSHSAGEQQSGTKVEDDQDLGPLGIFARHDIKAGELVMVDQCLTAVSNISPSRLQHCEACHATLEAPFIQPNKMVKPVCCNAVAYCSGACYLKALDGNSYHKVICKKDFEWLYDANGSGVLHGAGYKWRKVMFLRIMAIIIADRGQQILEGKRPTHPLQHDIIARMAANYASPEKLHPDMLNDWQYHENIVAPTKILMMLGINIFTDPDFSPEVIQTIYWRMENNANMSIVDLGSHSQSQNPPHASAKSSGREMIHMICLNPQYLFFNHSCEPNISWHGAIPNPYVGLDWITGYKGEIMKVGSSAVFCKTVRDIKEGEELKISYVGDPSGEGDDESEEMKSIGRKGKRSWLKKWFEGGCGCELCEREMRDMSVCGTDDGEIMDLDLMEKLEKQI